MLPLAGVGYYLDVPLTPSTPTLSLLPLRDVLASVSESQDSSLGSDSTPILAARTASLMLSPRVSAPTPTQTQTLAPPPSPFVRGGGLWSAPNVRRTQGGLSAGTWFQVGNRSRHGDS